MGDDPIAQVRAFLAEHDPDVLAAVDDVDRGLIGNTLELSPMGYPALPLPPVVEARLAR